MAGLSGYFRRRRTAGRRGCRLRRYRRQLGICRRGRVTLGYDAWVFSTQFSYMGLGVSQGAVSVDLDEWLVEPTVGYEFCKEFQAFAGVRYNNITSEIRGPFNAIPKTTKDWWDPIVGAQLSIPLVADKLKFAGRFDVGGFGVGSDLILGRRFRISIGALRNQPRSNWATAGWPPTTRKAVVPVSSVTMWSSRARRSVSRSISKIAGRMPEAESHRMTNKSRRTLARVPGVAVWVAAFTTGCSGINASKSVSPLDFLLPGLGMQRAAPAPGGGVTNASVDFAVALALATPEITGDPASPLFVDP